MAAVNKRQRPPKYPTGQNQKEEAPPVDKSIKNQEADGEDVDETDRGISARFRFGHPKPRSHERYPGPGLIPFDDYDPAPPRVRYNHPSGYDYPPLHDCCDGSDEYDGKVKCSKHMLGAGRVTREKLKRKLATYKEGFEIRRKEVEHAKLIAKKIVELASLKEEATKLKDLVDKLTVTKEAIEEEQERLKREIEEQRIKDAEKQAEQKESLQSMESSDLDSQHVSQEIPESSVQVMPVLASNPM